MSVFERYLSVWVALCIVAGVALGHIFPGAFQVIGAAEIAQVNIPVAVLIWLMIIPMLVKIDFAALREVGEQVKIVNNSKAWYESSPAVQRNARSR